MQEADLSKPFESFKEEIKATCNKNEHVKLSNVHPDNITEQKKDLATCKLEEYFMKSCKEMPPVPKNAVQFLVNWKKYTSFDFRYRYLKVSNNLLYTKREKENVRERERKSISYIQIFFLF